MNALPCELIRKNKNMSELRVMIVDDEERVIGRVSEILNEMGGDILIVGSFHEAVEAENSLISTHPDVLITDVKMPYMLGTDLIRTAKEVLPLLKSIIISGYDSFDYAKDAISLGVVSYINKPVKKEDLEKAFKIIAASIKEKTFSEKEFIMMRERVATANELIAENDLFRLTEQSALSNEMHAKILSDGVHLDERYHLLVLFDADEDLSAFHSDSEEVFLVYGRKFFQEIFAGFTYNLCNKPDCNFALFHSEKPFDIPSLTRMLKSLLAQIGQAVGFSVSCALSQIGEGKEANYRLMFLNAQRSLSFRPMFGSEQVLRYDDLFSPEAKNSTSRIDESEYGVISYSILYGKKDDSEKNIISFLSSVSKPEFKDVYFFSLSGLLIAILKSCLSFPDLWAIYVSENALLQTLTGFKNADGSRSFFLKLSEDVIEINGRCRESGVEKTFVRIKNYIDSNYQKSSLSLESISQELSFSVSYISSILKRNGISFTKYLTELRMKKAKEMLADPEQKIITIAYQVGYVDPYYFSHCFKKFYGVSPDEFRKK